MKNGEIEPEEEIKENDEEVPQQSDDELEKSESDND